MQRLTCNTEKTLLSLPYSKEYLELLSDINNETITFDDIKKPSTPAEEYHAQVVLEGVTVKRDDQVLKENIVSPELSAQCIALHTQDQFMQIISSEHETWVVRD